MAASARPMVVPRSEEILSRLEKGTLYPLYLFHGDEAYLIDCAVILVRRRVGHASAVRTFYAGQDPIETVLEAWGAPSLFAPQNLVVLKSAEHLKVAERERLAKEAELRDATQPLVVCAHGRVDVTQKFFALCHKRGFVAEFRPPFPNQVPLWAQRFARERGVRLQEEAARLLAELVGPDLLALSTEVDKLSVFVFPQTDITADTVAACTGELYRNSAFDFADAIGQRDSKGALELLRRVLVDERGALLVLHALVSHFRRLWQVKELVESGVSGDQIERTVGIRGMRLHALLRQSQLYTQSDLRQIFHRAATLDIQLKSIRISPGALFAALVFEMCARPA